MLINKFFIILIEGGCLYENGKKVNIIYDYGSSFSSNYRVF
ncbi:hypothetical protein BN1097_190032 [Clostridioides difficile]|uniref:Uncharacterized protein n=1 Tax=Clostridioides difficile TaxID=1496 RepID=A0A069A5U7_CLODI|nr:hypothetical protein BN171_450007 [Clostridioides difficile E25]CCL44588.1 hypothetical protein BN178_160006 [Clostridioides difficile T42]CCL55445.1 hypothetical protein BN180_320007 [Clostridioides difficile E14]CCL78306.1 hypothetical protein BN186_280015 [Clostridioides difficile E23]CDS83795.1 hypothetical protein BN1097_190032 [Clostridioides difficile]